MTWYADPIAADWQTIHSMEEPGLIDVAGDLFELIGGEGRYAGGPVDKLKQWISDEVRPVLRSMGQRGQQLWSYLTDANSLANVNRIGALVILFSLVLGHDQVTPANVTALVCLAVQVQSKDEASLEKKN